MEPWQTYGGIVVEPPTKINAKFPTPNGGLVVSLVGDASVGGQGFPYLVR